VGQPCGNAELSHQQTTISPPKVTQSTDSPIKKGKGLKCMHQFIIIDIQSSSWLFPLFAGPTSKPCPKEMKKADCQLNYFTIPELHLSRWNHETHQVKSTVPEG
jgi:hypothetical protein